MIPSISYTKSDEKSFPFVTREQAEGMVTFCNQYFMARDLECYATTWDAGDWWTVRIVEHDHVMFIKDVE